MLNSGPSIYSKPTCHAIQAAKNFRDVETAWDGCGNRLIKDFLSGKFADIIEKQDCPLKRADIQALLRKHASELVWKIMNEGSMLDILELAEAKSAQQTFDENDKALNNLRGKLRIEMEKKGIDPKSL